MKRINWSDLRHEFLSLYAPPLRPRATWFAVRRLFDILELELEVHSTRELTPSLVARFAARPGLSPRTVKGQLSYLSTFCSYCVRAGVLESNPVSWRRRWIDDCGYASRSPRKHLGLRELEQVLRQADVEAAAGWEAERLRALVYTLAYLGLRRSEALGLRLEDLDLEGGTLSIVAHATRRLKTTAAAAVLPIPAALLEVLRVWAPRCGSEWVFPSARRRESPWLHGSSTSRPLGQLRRLGERAGVEGVNALVFRHSFATHAEGPWGMSEGMIGRVLRHTSPLTAKRNYRHPDLCNMRDQLERVVIRERGLEYGSVSQQVRG